MLFELTQKQIDRGFLTAEDFSSAAGFRVVPVEISQLPHYKELKTNLDLPVRKLEERARAIFIKLAVERCFTQLGDTELTLSLDAASKVFPFAYYYNVPLKHADGEPVLLNEISVYSHFDVIKNVGFERANEPGSPIWQTCERNNMKSFMLFPGLLYETVPNGVVLKKTGGIVFINRSITPQESFSRETLIPEALLDNVSGEKTLWLMFDLQEMRYMQQVSYYAGEEDMLRLGFYSGLDADMFARAALKKANIGEKTREAFMHARYIELFGLKDSQYWFAPSLDAMENGKDPSDYDKTINAVRELRMRTAMKHIGIDEKKYTSETLQYLLDMSSMNLPKDEYSSFVSSMLKAFDIITIEHIGESPAPIYTTLRQIVEGGSITDPFAQSIAEKILDAANFFNPDLTHADAQASRERMEKRMRAVHNKGAGLG